MDRITRKELKTDKFAVEVAEILEFLEGHKRQAVAIGAALVAVVLAAVGILYYQNVQQSKRQEALDEALRVYDANIGTEESPFFVTFPTQEEKDKAVEEAFTELATKYDGTEEASIARFYLGLSANRQGQADKAEEYFRKVAEDGKPPYDSQAAYSLAQLYAGQGKTEEAKQLLRDLIENPSVLVSKEQATIALARLVGKEDPEEARKLLEPLRTARSAVSRAALTALGELSQESQ